MGRNETPMTWMTASALLAPAAESLDIWTLITKASGVVMGVLILLAFFSVVGWYVIAYKYFYLRRAARESEKFLEVFWTSKRLDAIYASAEEFKHSPISAVFKAGYVELSKIKSAE
ncbi:MAG: hypothetical protein DRO01_05965, partial [Thermoproteota archaeon]